MDPIVGSAVEAAVHRVPSESVRIPLDRHGGTPLYRQIEDWLRRDILSGGLPADTRLPATRTLAEELGVSRITVVNAYAGLEGDGLVRSGVGSGTFVAPRAAVPVRSSDVDLAGWPGWQRAGSPDPPGAEPAPQELRHPDPIAFTGVGDPRRYPVAELSRTIKEVLGRDGTAALEYGRFDSGYEPLRHTVVRVLASQGIHADRAQVLITSGSQQALALTCQVLLEPGDAVLVEEPTYDLALDLFRTLGLRVVGVPVDAAGMRVDLVEPLLQQHRPRLVYTIPNFQNPSGTCLTADRRRHLLALAERYDVPVVEDDFVGDLRYEGRAQPAIKALDGRGQVIYLGTFSKMLMPGLRVGYLLADGPVLGRLAQHKRVQDLTTAPLMQRVLERYVTVGRYQAHLRRTTRLYRRRRDVLLTALREHLPDVVTAPPQGGLFAWLTLPDPVTAGDLLRFARQQGVDFAAGSRFFLDPRDGDRFARLNFAAVTPDEITRGVQRLGTALDRARRP